jgi:hypothetical protein
MPLVRLIAFRAAARAAEPRAARYGAGFAKCADGSEMHVLSWNAAFALAIATVGVGCVAQIDAGSAATEGPAADDYDVAYVPAPPVADIETYPVAIYQGASVYFVDGRWYRHGPRGWAYYRQEPPALASERQQHWGREHDPRWAPRPAPPARAQEPHVAPPPPGVGVTEIQPHDHRAQPGPGRPENAPAPQPNPPNHPSGPPSGQGTNHAQPAPQHPPPQHPPPQHPAPPHPPPQHPAPRAPDRR